MQDLMENDILTKVSRYNLIRNQRMVYIDVHDLNNCLIKIKDCKIEDLFPRKAAHPDSDRTP